MKIPTPNKIVGFFRIVLGVSFIVLGLLMEFRSEFFNFDETILVIIKFVLIVLGLVMLFFKKL